MSEGGRRLGSAASNSKSEGSLPPPEGERQGMLWDACEAADFVRPRLLAEELPAPAALLLQARHWARRLRYGGPIEVRWNLRMRSRAGRADAAGLVELNPRLLATRRGEILATLAHEVCHLAAGFAAGHGPRWRQMMGALGFPAAATHRIPSRHLQQARRHWIWSCTGCGKAVRRSHRGARRFRCLCGGSFLVKRGNPPSLTISTSKS